MLASFGIRFRYFASSLTNVLPSHGPFIGGTAITIFGENFGIDFSHNIPSSLLCVFDDTLHAKATLQSTTMITCHRPRENRSAVQRKVRVKQSGSFYHGVLYFMPTPEPLALGSQHPMCGPSEGGTVVVISLDFEQVLDVGAHCLFGKAQTPLLTLQRSLFSPTNRFYCVSPPSATNENASLSVSFNSVDILSLYLSFEYEAPLTIHRILPMRGPSEGGSPTIVHGHGFRQSINDLSSLKCMLPVSTPSPTFTRHTRASAIAAELS